MNRLAGVLAIVCAVLLVLAFDEGGARAAYETVRDRAVPMAERVIARAGGRSARDTAAPAAGVYPVIIGEFRPKGETPLGAIRFEGALVRLEDGIVWRTTPHRIAYGREAWAAEFKAGAEAQIEVRRIVPVAGSHAVGASAACGGAVPGWLALLPRRDRLDLMLFRDGPAPGTTDSAGALCGRWVYDRR